MKELLTVCIVNFNSADFVANSLYCLKKLTKNKYKVFILDNGSNLEDFQKLKEIVKDYDNIFLERKETNLRGSIAHGTALNYLVSKVDSSYFSILDADATWLIKGWDEILIRKISDKIKVVGTEAAGNKPKDFPLMYAMLFETEAFRKMNIDFKTRDISKYEDTGHEMRVKYMGAGFQGTNITFKNTRLFKKGPFKDVICGEYYLEGYIHIFASHFGRGAMSGQWKYVKGCGIFYRLPKIGKYLRILKGKQEKKRWIKICKDIIDKQLSADIDFNKVEFEEVNCLFCKEKSEKKFLFSLPDRVNNLPGIFNLVRCRKCGLVFQTPRPKEECIKYYYPDEAGYFQPVKGGKYLVSIGRVIRINYFAHNNLGKRNLFLKLLLYPLYFYFYRYQVIPRYVENGQLLEIGCSHGSHLEKLKDYGWDISGIELNEKAAEYGIENRELDIKVGSILDYEFPDNSFDVVIMNMVLEHLYHPDSAITKISKWLKPDGQLLLSIPYYEGFEFKVFKDYAYGLQLPCHLYFFNKSHIRKLLRSYYGKIKFVFHHFDRDIVASAHYKYQNSGNLFWKVTAYNRSLRFCFIKPFVFLLSLLGLTSRITVKAVKR